MDARSHRARRRHGARGRPRSAGGWIAARREARGASILEQGTRREGARCEARHVCPVLWPEAQGMGRAMQDVGVDVSVLSRKDIRFDGIIIVDISKPQIC
jgi:hypothetical protein